MRSIHSLIVLLLPLSSWAAVCDLSVALRGKKYSIEDDVATVAEIEEKMKELADGATGRLLFGGKRLNSEDILTDVGVTNGSSLNMVPGATPKKKSSKKSSTAGATETVPTTPSDNPFGGVPPESMEDVMKSMGNVEESLNQMTQMMSNPMFKEFISDPEKLEQARQMMLQNPMLKAMIAQVPGMEDVINDPDAWRETMKAAMTMYQNMDPEDLKKAMLGQFGGSPTDFLKPPTASESNLDELSEGDD